MRVEDFIDVLGCEFYSGVPDSLLSALCDELIGRFGVGAKHVIAANEGNAVGLAAGYHLATGKIPLVYLQNSGEGNIVNPAASLLHKKVYRMPCIFVVGWRGEPGVTDEPQHCYQGEITGRLLDDLEIAYTVIDNTTTVSDIEKTMQEFLPRLEAGLPVAFVVRKGALTRDKKGEYQNANPMSRVRAIDIITEVSAKDRIICTTGKAGRELFEIRERKGQGHESDFLNVGSMGHASSIGLGFALNRPDEKVWCIDGDGAVLMHMGAMAVIAAQKPDNLIHVVINNGAHESVGGYPTVMGAGKVSKLAGIMGYGYVSCVSSEDELKESLLQAKAVKMLSMIEIMCNLDSRSDLGRPTTTPLENKTAFMK